MKIQDLKTPALILDYDILEENIKRMQQKADENNVKLRPHIKTHKCTEIARLQVKSGAIGITSSTIQEVYSFAHAGFSDITWAFPFNPAYLEEVFSILKKINLGLLIDSNEAFEIIENKSKSTGIKPAIWLEIDSGQHRSGIDFTSKNAQELANRILKSKHINFVGLLTHAGHAYNAQSVEEVKKIAIEEQEIILNAKEILFNGLPINASIGSTPTISLADQIKNIDEIRPGNYVFYDYSQVLLGSCKVKDCALSVLSTIVSINKQANRLIIDAGALSLSKDTGPPQFKNYSSYGMIHTDLFSKNINQNLRITNLTQEHGIIACSDESSVIERYKYGDKVRILMNHSCLTTSLFDFYYVVSGDKVIDRWEILRGRNLSK